MEKIRGFEIAKGFENKDINLPERKTKYSAGYDIEAAEDIIIPSFKKGMNPTLVKTGIKAYMGDNEYLMLANRSSNPKKKGLILANSVGIIDKDYYGNEATSSVKITKAKATVKAPSVAFKVKKLKYFKVSIKANKKPLKNVKIKVKVKTGKKYKTYNLKTNSKGIAKLNTKQLKVGRHPVFISSGNSNCQINAKSLITIKR